MGITVLSDFQFDVLEKHLQAEGFRRGGLFQDVLDHMYCLTTRYMENGLSFEQAMKMASSDLHPDGLGGIDEEVTQYLHFSFHCRMNKLLYGAAFVAAFGQTLYILFKTLHWPAANLSLIVACTALLLVVIPILTWQYLRTRSTKSALVRWRIVSGILALIFFDMNHGIGQRIGRTRWKVFFMTMVVFDNINVIGVGQNGCQLSNHPSLNHSPKAGVRCHHNGDAAPYDLYTAQHVWLNARCPNHHGFGIFQCRIQNIWKQTGSGKINDNTGFFE